MRSAICHLVSVIARGAWSSAGGLGEGFELGLEAGAFCRIQGGDIEEFIEPETVEGKHDGGDAAGVGAGVGEGL